MPTTVIGDIHGEAALLRTLLCRIDSQFGPGDDLIFVGDLIDRGHDNRGVVEIVRALVEAGRAVCLMGNHELNAVLFHTRGPDGAPLREHTDVHLDQHAAFLRDYPFGAKETRDVIDWFKTLPIFTERADFRVIHAQWDEDAVARLRRMGDGKGALPSDWTARWLSDSAFRADLSRVTKGQDFSLPGGATFTDKTGRARTKVRLAWWHAASGQALSDQIAGPTKRRLRFADHPPMMMPEAAYPPDAPTVVFGHYGMTDDMPYRAPNVVCVDHTRRAGGPLTAWRSDGTVMQIGGSD